MRKLPAVLLIASLSIVTTSCGSKSPKSKAVDSAPEAESIASFNPNNIGSDPASHLPKAVIYKTSGEYNNNVPVTLSDDGKQIVSYPAPTDLTDESTPVTLIDGWLLDRRGVSKNSVFTDYTYEQYRALEQAPSPQELLEHVIKGARVTAIIQMPMTTAEAVSDTAAVDSLIRSSTIVKMYDSPERHLPE